MSIYFDNKFKKLLIIIYFFILLNYHLPLKALKWDSCIIHQNKKREFKVYIPGKYSKKFKSPLVIVLHGGSGNNIAIERFTGFSKLAEKENFLVAYPDSYHGNWNDGREIKQSKSYRLNIDDTGFILKMIEIIKTKYNIDDKKIYIAGISNGGFMALRLACELSDRLAGVAAVCATMSEFLSYNCKPKSKVSILIMNGTDDRLVPFLGGDVKIGKQRRGKIKSTEWTINYWIKFNECEKIPSLKKSFDNKNDGTEVEKYIYRGKYGADVYLYKIINGGHTWPDRVQYLPEKIIGKVSYEIDATKEIWNFFKNHPKVNENTGIINF